jgi:hypothetical protein
MIMNYDRSEFGIELAGVKIGWTEQNALVHELNQITPKGSVIPGRS